VAESEDVNTGRGLGIAFGVESSGGVSGLFPKSGGASIYESFVRYNLREC